MIDVQCQNCASVFVDLYSRHHASSRFFVQKPPRSSPYLGFIVHINILSKTGGANRFWFAANLFFREPYKTYFGNLWELLDGFVACSCVNRWRYGACTVNNSILYLKTHFREKNTNEIFELFFSCSPKSPSQSESPKGVRVTLKHRRHSLCL